MTPYAERTTVGCTGWVLVHPTKGVDWTSITYEEDRPGGLMVRLTNWRWQRVVVSLDRDDIK